MAYVLFAYRQAFANFFSLGLLRATDALVQLFLIPVIISRVGIGNFGIIAFVQVFLNYGKTIIDYGFNISGVRQLALAGEDKERLSAIFSQILFSRALIALLVMAGLFVLVLAVPHLRQNASVFFWGFLLLSGHVLFTDWLFIGLQQARFIAAINLATKLLYALLVLLFIRQPADHPYVLALLGISGIGVGAAALFFIRRRLGLWLQRPHWAAIRQYLRSDFQLLLTNLSIEFNSSYGILVLNILTSNALTGYFSVMQKLVQPLRFLLAIFSQAIFPLVCERTRHGLHSVLSFLRASFGFFLPFALGAIALMYVFAGPLFRFFAGSLNESLLFNFRLYLAVPLVVLFNIPAYQLLLAYERKRSYTSVYLAGLMANIFLAYALTRWYGLTGAVLSVILVECLITTGLYLAAALKIKN